MATLEEQFQLATKHFETIYANSSDKQKLRLYALYNQAVNGDVDPKSAPSSLQVVKNAKFQARKRCMGMPADVAMKRYISELRRIDPDWGASQTSADPKDDTLSPPGVTPTPAPRRKKMGTAGLFKRRSKKLPSSKKVREEFEKASEYAKQSNLFASLTSQSLLYSYYKQATVGPCNTPAPVGFSKDRYARWRAWANLFDMPREEAMHRYTEHVKRFAPNYHTGMVPDHERLLPSVAEAEEATRVARELQAQGEGPAASPEVLMAALADAGESGGMVYLITGASGFLGTFLIEQLLRRNMESLILAVTREGSVPKLRRAALERFGEDGASRILPIAGDVSRPDLGLKADILSTILASKTGVEHFFHLAASYNMLATEEANRAANVDGTKHAVRLANKLGKTFGTTFQYCSSIVVAGRYSGLFLEASLDEGQDFDNPYAQTKFEAEKLVRKECTAKFRVYRPGIVVGHSQTGEAMKIDGPYYFFKPLQQMRKYMPSSITLPCVEGASMPLVPVDYVVSAMDAIAHKEDPSLDGRAFHLVDSSPPTFLEVMNILAAAAHTPRFSSRLVTFANAVIPRRMWNAVSDIPILRSSPEFLAKNVFKIPESVMRYVYMEAEWDDSDARDALRGSGIRCPPFEKYAWRIWDYYERFMDRSLDKAKALREEVGRKTVLVTGASDGIGLTLAQRLADADAHVILVARSLDKLEKARASIVDKGGSASIYTADLSKDDSTAAMIKQVIADHGHLDLLINNAGRSIRRSIEYQYDRFHDFQRCIDLNYYGSLRCILGFLPGMRERRVGHIINISSIGAITNAPRFGAYIASKGALDAFSRCISSEVDGDNVIISTVYMPLVGTKMIESKGNKYDHMNVISTEEASGLIERAIVTKERVIETDTGRWVRVGYFLAPALTESVLNVMYKLEPEAAPAGQKDKPSAQGDRQQLAAVRRLMKGAI